MVATVGPGPVDAMLRGAVPSTPFRPCRHFRRSESLGSAAQHLAPSVSLGRSHATPCLRGARDGLPSADPGSRQRERCDPLLWRCVSRALVPAAMSTVRHPRHRVERRTRSSRTTGRPSLARQHRTAVPLTFRKLGVRLIWDSGFVRTRSARELLAPHTRHGTRTCRPAMGMRESSIQSPSVLRWGFGTACAAGYLPRSTNACPLCPYA